MHANTHQKKALLISKSILINVRQKVFLKIKTLDKKVSIFQEVTIILYVYSVNNNLKIYEAKTNTTTKKSR